MSLHCFLFQTDLLHPVNYIRNVALRAVRTKHVFLIDMDFIPSTGSHEVLRERIQGGALDDKQVCIHMSPQIVF